MISILFIYIILSLIPFFHLIQPLERSIFVRTSIPLPTTSAPDITHLLRPTSFSTTILSHNTTLCLQQIVCLYQALIRQHRVGYISPEGCVERGSFRPCAVYIIRGAGVIFEFPNWTSPCERFGDISEVRLDTHDLEGFSINLIELVASIVAGQRSDGGANEPHC